MTVDNLIIVTVVVNNNLTLLKQQKDSNSTPARTHSNQSIHMIPRFAFLNPLTYCLLL